MFVYNVKFEVYGVKFSTIVEAKDFTNEIAYLGAMKIRDAVGVELDWRLDLREVDLISVSDPTLSQGFVVAEGTGFSPYVLRGPFKTFDEAESWGDKNCVDFFTVVPIEPLEVKE
jgi:hypothetical protein